MTTIELTETWAFNALVDDLRFLGIQTNVHTSKPSVLVYSLADSERLLVVRLQGEDVTVHALFPTPSFIEHWLAHIKGNYPCN